MTGARADGAEFPVELTLSDWTLDDRRYVTAIIRDVTEREAAERAVREAQAGLARLGTAIDQASDSVLITDTDARILYVNPAFERTSGYRRDEVVGQNPRLLASGEHPPAFYQDLWDTLTAGRTWHGEIVNKRKDGTRFIIDATIGPVRDAAGAVTAYVAVKRDVTAERDLEARLRQAQRMEAVGQLAGGVAHDFNNLLAAISGYAEFVRAALPDAAESRHDINEVLRATERAAELTRQLLAFSRRQALAPVVLDPAEVIGGVVPMLRRLLGEHIALVTANEIGDVRVVADRGQLEQVIVNLAVNARDAMPEGGRLSITAGTAVLTPDDVADTPDLSPGPVARITVADTGTGIDAAVLPRIFDPFFTTKAAGKGTGLGLATVYGIVRASGGRITVASTPGAGSRFCIDLPVSSVVPSTGETAATPVGPPPLRATVLLVEDERAVRVVLARHLAGAGCVVHQAASGEQALLLWPALPQIDLVVSDVRMPGIQGPDLVRRLRALRPGLPALLISGYAEGLTLDAPGLDGVRLLDKPFEAARLVEIVRAMVDGDAGPSAD
jgi:PAS domain S-box-containing protein